MKELKFRVWNDEHKFFSFWGFIRDGVFAGIPDGGGLTIDICKKQSQQYTGLKDKKGKEIYEGDIVQSICGGRPYFVMYQAPKFICKHTKRAKTWVEFILSAEEKQFYEIIGNIYESPELLEGK